MAGLVASKLIALASEYIGRTEVTSNDAPWLRELLSNAGLGWQPGMSYCIAALEALLDTACREIGITNPIEHTLSAVEFYAKGVTARLNGKIPEAGDIVIFKQGTTWHGHAGLIIRSSSEGIHTIEFNTSDCACKSQRNGGGVYYKFRSFAKFQKSDDPNKLWIVGYVKTSML